MAGTGEALDEAADALLRERGRTETHDAWVIAALPLANGTTGFALADGTLRLLRPGGVLLTNFWCTDFYFHNGLDMGTGAPLYMHWFFTPIQVENLLCALGLGCNDYTLAVYGNLLAKTAFLMNMPVRELTPRERDTCDRGQPLLICARIVRPVDWQCARPPAQDPHWLPDAAPLRLHPETGHYGDAYLR